MATTLGARRGLPAHGIGAALLISALGLTVLGAYEASATPAPPQIDLDNASPSLTCTDMARLLVERGTLPSAPNWAEWKITAPTGDGAYRGPLDVTLAYYDGTYFQWSSAVPVDLMLVRSGASTARAFVYDPPEEATWGQALTVEDITSIAFCYDTASGNEAATTVDSPTSTTVVGGATPTTEGIPTTEAPTTSSAPTTTRPAPGTTPPTSNEPATSIEPTTTIGTEITTVTLIPTEVRREVLVGDEPGPLPRQSDDGVLAFTGRSVGQLVVVAGALLLSGVFLTYGRFRREGRSAS